MVTAEAVKVDGAYCLEMIIMGEYESYPDIAFSCLHDLNKYVCLWFEEKGVSLETYELLIQWK